MLFGFEYRFYDDLSRLIEADYNKGTTVYNYGYDVAGNMIDYDGVNRTFNAENQMTNNRLSSVGNHSYVYDGLGNRVQQTVSSVVGMPLGTNPDNFGFTLYR